MTLCGGECESVVHILWKCSSCSVMFLEMLYELLGDKYTCMH